jgi:hypothetical protein
MFVNQKWIENGTIYKPQGNTVYNRYVHFYSVDTSASNKATSPQSVKLGKSGSKIREMLVQVYGDNAMEKTAVYKRVTRFSEGRERVTDEERSGWWATSRTEGNIAKAHQIAHENCRLTVRNIAEQVNINRETIRKIKTEDLYMRKVCAKMVPKDLLTWHCLRELLASKQRCCNILPIHQI